MNIPPSTFTAEEIILKLLRRDFYNKSAAYQAILYCNKLLHSEATGINISDLRGRHVLTYYIEEKIKKITINWDDDDFRFIPARQSIFPHQI